jgi:cytochrome c551/c552
MKLAFTRQFLPVAVTWAVVLAMASLQAQQTAPAAPSPSAALLTQYCITCHNGRLKTAGLALDAVSMDHVAGDAATWEKAVVKIRSGMMPPSGARARARRARCAGRPIPKPA